MALSMFALGDCTTKTPFPTGQTPGLQRFRPPLQTATQLATFQLNVRDAANFSAAAEPWLRETLEAARPSLKDLPCANATTDELVEIVRWEYQHLSLLHNGPLAAEGSLAGGNKSCRHHMCQHTAWACERRGALGAGLLADPLHTHVMQVTTPDSRPTWIMVTCRTWPNAT